MLRIMKKKLVTSGLALWMLLARNSGPQEQMIHKMATNAPISLEDTVNNEEPNLLFNDIHLDAELDPMVDLYTKVFTTDNAIIYNAKSYKILKEIPVKKGKNLLTTPDSLANVVQEKKKLEQELVRKKEIKYGQLEFRVGQKSNIEENINKLSPWLGHIRKEFEYHGISKNALAIFILESCLNPNAVSPVKAVGIGQFMKDTARNFMMMNSSVDERLDPIYGARATARNLALHFVRYGREEPAIGAHHTGIGNYDKAIIWALKNMNNADDQELFKKIILDFTKKKDIRGSFGDASKKYVPLYKGAENSLLQVYAGYFNSPELEFDMVKINNEPKRNITIMQVIKELGISKEDLSWLNPSLLYLRKADPDAAKYMRKVRPKGISQTIPAGFWLRLPVDKASEFVSKFSQKAGSITTDYYRRNNNIQIPQDTSQGDLLYRKIIEIRKSGKFSDIRLKDLEAVRNAYWTEMELHKNNSACKILIGNKLAIVENDIRQYQDQNEKNRGISYFDKLEIFSDKIREKAENSR
jgi:hypothetical protein